MTTVNYLLVACSHRAYRDPLGHPPGKYVLRFHLQQLIAKRLGNLSQLTIVLPIPPERGANALAYWSICKEVEMLSKRTKVHILEIIDSWWSYSAWIQAIQYYKTAFDYCILIEDDFYPAHPDFINVLIRKHQEKLPNGGYLGSFYDYNHMALSNGIVDSRTFLEGVQRYKDPIKELAPGAQVQFSQLFFTGKMADYTDEFRCLTFRNTVQELRHPEQIRHTIDIFNPIQALCMPIEEV